MKHKQFFFSTVFHPGQAKVHTKLWPKEKITTINRGKIIVCCHSRKGTSIFCVAIVNMYLCKKNMIICSKQTITIIK